MFSKRQNEQEVQSQLIGYHQNQNAFTGKRMKLTICITTQYKRVAKIGFKVKEVAGKM